jgi:tetratricopeptide (TPR) repeat protein
MQKLFLFVTGFFFFTLCNAQTVDELVKQADVLEKQMKETEAYQKFKEIVKQHPQHLYSLIKCSELASRIGKIQTNKDRQMDFYSAAKIYAERAIRINPNDSDANMVMAVAHGRLALMKNGKDKIASVKEIRNYAQKAAQLNPKNFKALHILGKWHYEVSNLNAMEKGAVKVLYGGLPKASYDSSLYYYEKAKLINPAFLLNHLELARVYYKLHKKEKAVETLKYMLKLPDAIAEDEIVKAEARKLLKEWG